MRLNTCRPCYAVNAYEYVIFAESQGKNVFASNTGFLMTLLLLSRTTKMMGSYSLAEGIKKGLKNQIKCAKNI